MLALLALLACAHEPETAEEWCVEAKTEMADCSEAESIGDFDCEETVSAKRGLYGDAYTDEFMECLAAHPCPPEWGECPAPPE